MGNGRHGKGPFAVGENEFEGRDILAVVGKDKGPSRRPPVIKRRPARKPIVSPGKKRKAP